MASVNRALLDVRDLSVAFGRSGEMIAADRVSFRIGKGETVALVGESGSGKTVSALSILQAAALSRRLASVGRSVVRRQGPPEAQAGAVAGRARQPHLDDLPGADDVAQPAAHHPAAGGRGAARAPAHGREGRARARAGAAAKGRHPRAGKAPRRVSASAVGRPAPARDDRHGARQRAGSADRRRADDGARRHHPGADPRAAEAAAARDGHGACCSSPTTSASSARWPSASTSCRAARSSRKAPPRTSSPSRSTATRNCCWRPSRRAIRPAPTTRHPSSSRPTT